jgi:hypothetical protein
LTELVKALEALGIAKVESGPVVEGELVSGE